MNEYQVTLPIAGAAYMTVHANSEEEAIEQAMDNVTIADIADWEPLHHITRGNVCYAPVWDAVAEDCGPVDEPAQGIEAAAADETRSGSAVGESPVHEVDAPND